MFGRLRILAMLAGSVLVGTGLVAYHPRQPVVVASPSKIVRTAVTHHSATTIALGPTHKSVVKTVAKTSSSPPKASSSKPSRTAAVGRPPVTAASNGAAHASGSTPARQFTTSSSSIAAPFAVVPVSRYNYGLNVFSYDQQLAAPSTIAALQALGTGVQQFPNLNTWSWTLNETQPGQTAPVSLAHWGQILQETGSQGLFIFNYDENPTWTGGGTPADATAVTQYIVQNHLPINAIVIGSEEYGSWDFAANMNPSTSASYYATQAAAIAQAIHAVDPSMLVGVSFDPGSDPYDLNWNQTLLRTTAPYINFVSVHDYPIMSPLSNSGLLSALPNYIAGEMHYVQSEISANVPPSLASRIQIWVTEFNPYWQPTVQSTQPVYGAAMIESAILWRALGAAKLIVWSYDGQAHSPSVGWPVDTTAGTPYAVFALAGDGQAPELPMNQLYPSGVALSQFMHAIGSGGTLTAWAGSNLVIGQVASANGYEAFLVNQSAAAQSIRVNGQTVTLPASSLTELPESGPIRLSSSITQASYTKPSSTPTYTGVPTVTSTLSTMYPGETVTLTGTNFGTTESSGYISIVQGSISYGAPTNAYKIRVLQWTNTTISFEVPNGYSGPALVPGTAAAVRVVSSSGVDSATLNVSVTAPPVLPITSVQPNPVSPGQWVTISGDGFGSSQGSGYVWISQSGVNWGAPGNAYPVAIQSWTNTSITFLAPTNAYEVDGHWEASLQSGVSATVQVFNAVGGESQPVTIQVTNSTS